MSDTILSVKNLKQHFEVGRGKNKLVVKAVNDISFDIKKGEVFGLVGESGCGKTTTGRTIIKLYDATDGNVYFEDKRIIAGTQKYYKNIKKAKNAYKNKVEELKIAKKYNLDSVDERTAKKLAQIDSKTPGERGQLLKEQAERVTRIREELKDEDINETILDAKNSFKQYIKEQKEFIRLAKNDNKIETSEIVKNIQMIFQDPISSLNPRMTVKEIIAEGLIINGEKDKELINRKVNDILRVVGLLPEHGTRYPHEFSGGQRQRIGIARALIINPKLLIADEPISALDVSIQAQVINLLKDLQEEMDLTILFIAHDLSVVKYFSDRIGVMYFGRMVELTTSEELFKNPIHPYTKSLLSAIPVPDPIYEKTRERFIYDPSQHKYSSTNRPSFVEIKPGHFVLASESEVIEYKKELAKNKKNNEEIKDDASILKRDKTSLSKMTVEELREYCRNNSIGGYSGLNKKDLINLIKKNR